MGPIGVKKHLAPFLPSHPVVGTLNSLSRRLSIYKNSYSDLKHITTLAPPYVHHLP